MTSERINPAELARPSGFSHAVSVGGGAAAGRMVFLAGQTGVDRAGNVADGGVVPQFERAMTNLLTALGAAGGLPSDLVSLTIYLTDMADYQAHTREIAAIASSNLGFYSVLLATPAGRNGVPGHGGGGRDPAVAARAAGRDPGHRRGQC